MKTHIAQWACAALLCIGLCVCPLAHALEFKGIVGDDGFKYLLLHDKRPCAPNESCGFTQGDAEQLNRALSSDRYMQVLLYSGGGDSREGQRVGEVLRARRVWVRVLKGHHCVSACTAAFLGGVIRQVDEGAEFRVHSSSSYLNGVPDSLLRRIINDPELALGQQIDRVVLSRVEWTLSRFAYVQHMIADSGNEQDLYAFSKGCIEQSREDLLKGTQFNEFVHKVKTEGAPALNEILESAERRTTALCLARLSSSVDRLGARGEHVLRIMNIMTASRIGATINLSQEALREAGFVTR